MFHRKTPVTYKLHTGEWGQKYRDQLGSSLNNMHMIIVVWTRLVLVKVVRSIWDF